MIARFASRCLTISSIVTVAAIAATALLWEPYHEIAATIAYLGIAVSAFTSVIALHDDGPRSTLADSSRGETNEAHI